jgi:diadenosine tetraphosphate (Ap4A) HIT family hydrolase
VRPASRERPCLICEQEDAADPALSVFCEDDGWAAGVVPGYDVPGWVVLRIRRHAEGLDALTDAELAAFGRRARDLVAAVRAVTGAAATYLMVFGEANPHFHALITPRTADIPVELRTGDILKLRLSRADLARATAMVPVLRAAYQQASGPAGSEHATTGRQDPAHAAVHEAEELRTKAMVAGDIATLTALLDDDCRYVHSSGAVDTKASYLAKLQAGEIGYSWIRTPDQRFVEVAGAVGVSHRMEAELVLAGVPRPYQSRAFSLWRGTPQGLRLAYFQATALPE